MRKVLQNTHWYRSKGGGYGFTSMWNWARDGELERVGLHDCDTLHCDETEEEHSGTTRDYYTHLVYAAEVARVARDETKELRTHKKGKTHNSKVRRK